MKTKLNFLPRTACSVVSSMLFAAGVASSAPAASFRGLGDLPVGGFSSSARTISKEGTVRWQTRSSNRKHKTAVSCEQSRAEPRRFAVGSEVFREEIAQTMAAPEEVEEELRHLLMALTG